MCKIPRFGYMPCRSLQEVSDRVLSQYALGTNAAEDTMSCML